jgi:hypothetical protein
VRRTIGWLWVIGTGVVVMDCGGQTTLTVEQPQPSGDAGGMDGSTPMNTDAADANAALACVGSIASAPTPCINGEVCVHVCFGASCKRIPAGCVIGSQACGLQVCNGSFDTWLNDREIECMAMCIY